MIAIIATAIACFIVGGVLSYILFRYVLKSKYDNVLKEAETEAEVIKKNKLLEVKEKFLNKKADLEKEVALRNQKIQQAENKLKQREMVLSQRQEEIQRKKMEAEAVKENLEAQLVIVDKKKEELDKLEKEQLSWREDSSVVSKINADAQKGIKTKLDADMTSWVEDSLELARRSNGAFDPTIGRLTRLWNIEGDNPKVPSKQEIKNTLKDTGYTKIHLEKVETQNTATTKKNVDKDIKDNTDKNGDAAKDTDNNTTNSTAQNTADNMVNNEADNTPDNTALNEERLETTDKKINTDESVSSIYIGDKCTLDLGAVGKGIACDVVQDYLKKQKEVGGAVIAVGGSILLYGSKADGSDWNVAVQNPRGQDGEAMGVLSLSGTTNVSTSGDYEKYFMQDGKRYHHILDPSTGYPADSGLISVTIVSDSGLLSDGLSTACFVLGKEKGQKLLETCGAEGIFIDQNKKVTVTKGLKDKFTILNEEYKQ